MQNSAAASSAAAVTGPANMAKPLNPGTRKMVTDIMNELNKCSSNTLWLFHLPEDEFGFRITDLDFIYKYRGKLAQDDTDPEIAYIRVYGLDTSQRPILYEHTVHTAIPLDTHVEWFMDNILFLNAKETSANSIVAEAGSNGLSRKRKIDEVDGGAEERDSAAGAGAGAEPSSESSVAADTLFAAAGALEHEGESREGA